MMKIPRERDEIKVLFQRSEELKERYGKWKKYMNTSGGWMTKKVNIFKRRWKIQDV